MKKSEAKRRILHHSQISERVFRRCLMSNIEPPVRYVNSKNAPRNPGMKRRKGHDVLLRSNESLRHAVEPMARSAATGYLWEEET